MYECTERRIRIFYVTIVENITIGEDREMNNYNKEIPKDMVRCIQCLQLIEICNHSECPNCCGKCKVAV